VYYLKKNRMFDALLRAPLGKSVAQQNKQSFSKTKKGKSNEKRRTHSSIVRRATMRANYITPYRKPALFSRDRNTCPHRFSSPYPIPVISF
jgi:hypothetical protein